MSFLKDTCLVVQLMTKMVKSNLIKNYIALFLGGFVEFSDFPNTEDLKGKEVLEVHESSMGSRSRRIGIISRVNKTGFKIKHGTEENTTIFRFNGQAKNSVVWHSGDHYCKLITPEEKVEILQEFKDNKEKKIIKELITKNLPEISLEKLRKIKMILDE